MLARDAFSCLLLLPLLVPARASSYHIDPLCFLSITQRFRHIVFIIVLIQEESKMCVENNVILKINIFCMSMQEQQKYDASWDIFVLVWCSVASYCAVSHRRLLVHISMDVSVLPLFFLFWSRVSPPWLFEMGRCVEASPVKRAALPVEVVQRVAACSAVGNRARAGERRT